MAFPQAGGLNLHARIVDEFGRLIVEGLFGADQPIVPEDVSPVPAPRTVVREALRVLESRGMVTASELLELRLMIEPAGRADGRTAPQTRRSSRRWRPQRADVRSRRRLADSLVMHVGALTMVLAKTPTAPNPRAAACSKRWLPTTYRHLDMVAAAWSRALQGGTERSRPSPAGCATAACAFAPRSPGRTDQPPG
jgi:hypothetical protein